MNYTVPARAPRAPIIEPRARTDPRAFTLANIRTMQRVRIGWGRDRDMLTLPLAGVDVLTSDQARTALTELGTIPEVVDALTDEQVIAAAEATIPKAERLAAAKLATTTIAKVPIAGATKAPTTTRLSFGTPRQTGGAVIKQNALAIEEYESLLPAQVFPILHTRTGRSFMYNLNFDPAIGDPGVITLTGPPIPFACLITHLSFASPGWWGGGNAMTIAVNIVGVGRLFYGANRTSLAAVSEGWPPTSMLAVTEDRFSIPLHFLVPAPGFPVAMTINNPGLGPPAASLALSCDEVDIAMIRQGFLKPRAEANADNVARQGTINIKRSRPVILTIG